MTAGRGRRMGLPRELDAKRAFRRELRGRAQLLGVGTGDERRATPFGGGQ